MSLFKKFQLKPNNQTKASFKYIVLTSVNSLKLNAQSLNFTKNSNLFSSYKQGTFLDLRQKILNLNFKNLFQIEINSTNKIKFVKTSTIIATLTRQNLSSNLHNKRIKTFNHVKSLNKQIFNLNQKMNLKTKAIVENLLSIYKNFLLRIQIHKFKIKLWGFFNRKNFTSLSAMGGLFTWEEYKLSDDDIKHEVNEMVNLFDVGSENKTIGEANTIPHKVAIDFEAARTIDNNEWKLIYDKKDLLIWRRNISLENDDEDQQSEEKPKEQRPNYDLYEYKVLGRFSDITPLEFYQTQIDLDYRKEWDYLAVSLDIISKEPSTGTELVKWIMKFPYPLNPREYIYIRRYCIDPDAKILILVSKSIPNVKIDPDLIDISEQIDPFEGENHSKIIDNFLENKNSSKYVRVTKYESNIIIFPHDDFNKPGLYYVIQYYDINKAKIPKIAYKWMATSGLPDYLEKVHRAALELKRRNESDHIDEEKTLSKYDKIHLNENFERQKDSSTETINNESSFVHVDYELKSTESKTDNEVIEKNVLTKDEVDKKFVFISEEVLNDFFSHHEPHSVFYN